MPKEDEHDKVWLFDGSKPEELDASRKWAKAELLNLPNTVAKQAWGTKV